MSEQLWPLSFYPYPFLLIRDSANPKGLIRVTELADQLLQAGEFDVYQLTYESVDRLAQLEEVVEEPEDELEALGQAIDKEATESSNHKPTTTISSTTSDQGVTWYMKRITEGVVSKLEGPHTTQQLRDWLDQGKFSDSKITILVRQSDKENGQFYNINRIDFDLYD